VNKFLSNAWPIMPMDILLKTVQKTKMTASSKAAIKGETSSKATVKEGTRVQDSYKQA
jgi:hypothetical protein